MQGPEVLRGRARRIKRCMLHPSGPPWLPQPRIQSQRLDQQVLIHLLGCHGAAGLASLAIQSLGSSQMRSIRSCSETSHRAWDNLILKGLATNINIGYCLSLTLRCLLAAFSLPCHCLSLPFRCTDGRTMELGAYYEGHIRPRPGTAPPFTTFCHAFGAAASSGVRGARHCAKHDTKYSRLNTVAELPRAFLGFGEDVMVRANATPSSFKWLVHLGWRVGVWQRDGVPS